MIGTTPLTIADEYVYLGLVFKPSGSTTAAVQQLQSKASNAWFALSNQIYQNKKLSNKRAFQLVDSLVTPVGLYASEFWTPLSIPLKGFSDLSSLLKSWETFIPETGNQRICQLILSVHKKTSRLATLVELGRYPYFIKALCQSLKYEWSLTHNVETSSLLGCTLKEMEGQASQGIPNWLSKVRKIRELLSIPMFPSSFSPSSVGKKLTKEVQSNFDRFFLSQINNVNLGDDGLDHNKLRFYKTLKGSFTVEPYTELVSNRNQRVWLSRLRTSSHQLRIETGRWKKPPIPAPERTCLYCNEEATDNEGHFLLKCPKFANQTHCFLGRLGSIIPDLCYLSDKDKLSTILCPTSAKTAKITNKYISILFQARQNIDSGEHISNLLVSLTLVF